MAFTRVTKAVDLRVQAEVLDHDCNVHKQYNDCPKAASKLADFKTLKGEIDAISDKLGGL